MSFLNWDSLTVLDMSVFWSDQEQALIPIFCRVDTWSFMMVRRGVMTRTTWLLVPLPMGVTFAFVVGKMGEIIFHMIFFFFSVSSALLLILQFLINS